jgi:hypothetical protein
MMSFFAQIAQREVVVARQRRPRQEIEQRLADGAAVAAAASCSGKCVWTASAPPRRPRAPDPKRSGRRRYG